MTERSELTKALAAMLREIGPEGCIDYQDANGDWYCRIDELLVAERLSAAFHHFTQNREGNYHQ